MNDLLLPVFGLGIVGVLSTILIKQLTNKPKRRKKWVRPDSDSIN